MLRDETMQRGEWRKLFGKNLRTLSNVSYALTCKISKGPDGKLKPLYFHLTNFAFHALNSVLVLCLLKVLGFNNLQSGIGALFFAVHTLAVSAVANVAGRAGLMASTFSLLSLIVALQGIWWTPLSLLLFGVALLCKEEIVLLPLQLFLFVSVTGHWWGFLYLLPLLGIPLAMKLWYISWKMKVTHQHTGWPAPPTMKEFLLSYTYESLNRFPRWFLGWGYSVSPHTEEVIWSKVLRTLCIYVTLIGALFLWIPSLYLPLTLGVGSILLPVWAAYVLKPMPDVILEHRAYPSLVGFAIISAALIPQVPLWVMGVWGTVLALQTTQRAKSWNFGKINAQAIEDGSQKPMVLLNRSVEILSYDALGDAEALIVKALEQCPNAFQGWANIASVSARRGDMLHYYRFLRRGAMRCPALPAAWTLFAHGCEQLGLKKRAQAAYRHAYKLNPDDQQIVDNYTRIMG